MRPEALEAAIEQDIANGLTPCCVVGTLGTTGTLGMDDHAQIGPIAKKYGLWLHVDAAYAGTALLLPELQQLANGMEYADSFVFNPHKWMFTNFDCSIYYVKDASLLIKAMEILPEYLKNSTRGQVNDYRDWGVPLGRRFRALKLWFVMRMYGLEAIQDRLRSHIAMAKDLSNWIEQQEAFVLAFGPVLNVCGFYLCPKDGENEEETDTRTQYFMQRLNASGKVYLSHTRWQGRYVIRVVLGQTYLDAEHFERLKSFLSEHA
jgi:aromatic-L-amino-acid decarboxylase